MDPYYKEVALSIRCKHGTGTKYEKFDKGPELTIHNYTIPCCEVVVSGRSHRGCCEHLLLELQSLRGLDKKLQEYLGFHHEEFTGRNGRTQAVSQPYCEGKASEG